ncbi:hypothetical protein [Paraburkholderia sacchari]|uniref:hypothetical protein n=1 Tax=Paraburkholderia sacchari TaxID=159450 RepID=UPI003D9549C8
MADANSIEIDEMKRNSRGKGQCANGKTGQTWQTEQVEQLEQASKFFFLQK